jgi:hypothetical protein
MFLHDIIMLPSRLSFYILFFLLHESAYSLVKQRIAVVGGGPAGYFSAIQCAQQLSHSQKDYDVSKTTSEWT